MPKTLSHSNGIEVTLVDSMGSDLRIVNAARVSFQKQSEWTYWMLCKMCRSIESAEEHKKKHPASPPFLVPGLHVRELALQDQGLINFLMKNQHGTPFEKVVFEFHVRVPISVGREWMRHRVGSFNEVSTRYVEFEKSYYTPQKEDWRRQVGKAGRYTFETIDDGSEHAISVQYEMAMEAAFNTYDFLLKMGLAKEVARNVLPLGAMTEFYWTVNLRSLFNFLNLRTAPNALREIQIAARMVERLSSEVAPVAFAAWERHGRKAP